MSNINNLTNRILDEAKAKSEDILKSAHEEEKKILDKKLQEGKAIEEEIIEKAQIESQTRKDRIISNAELKVRNEKLSAKQQVISKVMNRVIDELSSMPQEKYLDYIKQRILSLDISGEETIIINSKDRNLITADFMAEINSALVNKGKIGCLTLSNEVREFKGGFILEKNGIEINNTFEALVDSMKEDLEYEVARVLFN